MKKKLIYTGVIALIVIVAICIAAKLTSDLKTRHTVSENVTSTIETNTLVENKNITEQNKDTKNENIEVPENPEKEKTDLEKAIEIVEEDWGPDSSVYFAQDGIENGKYKICVRDKSSTAALAWYTVNVEDGTFTKE